MRVRMLAGAAVVGLLVALLSPMAAFAQAQTTTVHFSGTESESDVNPCTGATGTATTTLKGVSHITELPNGTSHETSTATGTFTFVPDDPSQPTYTGHATFWDGENFNSKTIAVTFTGHVTVNANGTATVEFETERLSCP